MRYEIILNGNVYLVEVEQNQARLEGTPQPVTHPVIAQSTPVFVQPTPVTTRAALAPGVAVVAAPQNTEPLIAPMPGLISDVKVQVGQHVSAGQVLVILEAMKMENDIVSPRDAIVAEVNTAKGQSVKSGDVLLRLT